MNRTKKLFSTLQPHLPLLAVMLLAAFSRLFLLGRIPEGMTPDEAYGAYNAYSLLKEGIDSRGYAFPVYFIAWGSGMNVLYSYLAIPFFQLFGTSTLIYRLPQALFSIAAVYALFVTGSCIYHKKLGVFLAFLLAINPWHIMNTRFGLESNLAPDIMMLAMCFLVLGLKKNQKYLLAASLFFGAALYAYALSWLVIPPLLLLGGILFWKQLPKNRYLAAFCGLLFLLAAPLLWFVGINYGLLPEIKTSFFSIPKLSGFRGSEIDAGHIGENLAELLHLWIWQYDGVPYTASELVGAYYFVTSPFFLLGILYQIIDWTKKRNLFSVWMFLWLLCAFVMCALNENITMIHINLIHIPVIFYGGYGICRTAELVKSRVFLPAFCLFLCISFVWFYTDYLQTKTSYFFGAEAEEAIEAAKSVLAETDAYDSITIVRYSTLKYSNLLWHEKPSAADYAAHAVYTGDAAWAELASYGSFRYILSPEQADQQQIYLISAFDEAAMEERGFFILSVNDRYSLALPASSL